ncbi:MAG: DNA internalization-related competence protein ComEC/Rec2 [Deltaproteobacteria bacterium]|nr:DNA internalization-related competence protein ComEC/Rec2 [Deltaproteobacteria bacterium]
MINKVYSRPIIPLLISMISGIALGAAMPGCKVWAYLLVSTTGGLILCSIIFKPFLKKDFLVPIILFFALGYLLIQPWTSPHFPSNHIIHFTDSNKWKIVGTIDQSVEKIKYRRKFILNAESLEGKNRKFCVTGKIRVTVAGDEPVLSFGDRISFAASIKTIKNFKNPGGFDYKRYMAFKSVFGSSYVHGKKVTVINKRSDIRIRRAISNVRSRISTFIEKAGGGNHQGVLKALIVGQRQQIPQALRDAFNRAGVGHLLAISGLHIGIVASVAFIFFSLVLSRFKLVLFNAWVKKGAAILTFMPVLAYGLLSGMAPSTQRAVIMVGVFLMTFLFEREHDLMNTLALAAMLILIVHPPSVFSISFQLSFSAVLSIIYGLSKVHKRPTSLPGGQKRGLFTRIADRLFSFFLVSLFAIIGTLPLVMLYFNQASLIGIFANFLIIPIIGFIVVPTGLFSVFLYPVSGEAASWFMYISGAVLSKAISLVNLFSDLPFAAVKTITPSYFEICCYYIMMWALLNLKKVRPETPEIEKSDFTGKTARILVAIVALALVGDICYWLNVRFGNSDLKVTVIDVGQGSSALLELPGGYCILADGGGFYDNSVFDMGARVIAPFLWRKKIKTVDTLILSHPNSDHLNGLIYIARHFNVKSVWANDEKRSTRGYKKFMKVIKEKNIEMPNFKDMPRTCKINGVALEILYPKRDFLDKRKKDKWRDTNNNSLVVKANFGKYSFLLPGDIMKNAERELVSMVGENLASTVLIAPHHGSKSSNSDLFLDKVNPEYILISSGWKNRFHFPHPSVLKRYAGLGCKIFRTDINGAITMTTGGDSLEIMPYITGNK